MLLSITYSYYLATNACNTVCLLVVSSFLQPDSKQAVAVSEADVSFASFT